MAVLLIAGGTGLIGKRLLENHSGSFSEIRLLSRRPGTEGGVKRFAWDPAAGTYDPMAFVGVDLILNLAGAGIADKPWSEDRKREILKSRTDSLATLLKAVRETGAKPRLVLTASATGFYGDRGAEWVDETSAPGGKDSFLASTCVAWEKAAEGFTAAGFPLAVLRIGIVLSMKGGALPKMLLPLHAGVSNYFGNGEQYVPWVHIDDICRQIVWILEGTRTGIWNGVAPEPSSSKEMARALARVKGAWLTAPVPAFALRLALGDMSETVLTGARVSAERSRKEGFSWRFASLEAALRDLLGK